ncbi:MAG TPA: helix-turn-helix domain-containing protein [Thermomicrobiaceae bacterium]|nr:helix-turn-helix domain-containing protein [Thermomicrobiaceae bacterium]
MLDIDVIEDPATAVAALSGDRAQLLAELAEPKSASMLATAHGLPRQRVNYHLHELERYGLVEQVEVRRKGNMTERLVRSTARSYVISPTALASVAPDPARAPDRLSSSWLLAVASQLVRDVGTLVKGASRSRQRLATFTMDADIRFASAAERAAFAEELATAVTTLVARYHDADAPGGRRHRLVVAVHPSVTPDAPREVV